ncbi:hypothetical protein ACFVSK_11210 [Cellulosimicrobium cellulans]
MEHSALLLGFTSRPALAYTPDDLARWIADTSTAALGAGESSMP